jgi:hypothetical protein
MRFAYPLYISPSTLMMRGGTSYANCINTGKTKTLGYGALIPGRYIELSVRCAPNPTDMLFL